MHEHRCGGALQGTEPAETERDLMSNVQHPQDAVSGTRSLSPWLLPDDGIIDPIAVELTARGIRRVPLTHAERRVAAQAIMARGDGLNQVAKRLHVSGSTAHTLVA